MAGYSRVYSQGFIYWADETPNTLFEVPADQTAIVRDCNVCTIAGGVLVELFVAASAEAIEVPVWYSQVLGVHASDQFSGRIVVPGGGYIGINGAEVGLGVGVYVGGYLLAPAGS
jgi:hypothetical protein